VGIVGVKGMGGVGKTTMAKKLYDEPDVREWFSGSICWLEVGPNPSDDKIRDLQKQILKQFGNIDEDPGNPTRGRELLRQRLRGKRVLICLDNVWENVDTQTAVVDASDLTPGSRILKTSRKKESIGGHVHDLDSLEPGAAWELFCWHAFGGEKPPEGLAGLAERAAARCGGLPLALRVLGRQVAEAEDKKKRLTDFIDLPRDDDAMINCRSIIRTSYDNLPVEPRGLRDVFILIAGVWPRTPEFMQHQRAVENPGAAVYGGEPRSTRFTRARRALDKLNSLSLVGLKEDGGRWGLSLTVHDLIVDVAVSLADRTEQGCEKFFCQPADPEGLGLPDDSRGLKHLSIHSGSLRIGEVPAACSLVLGPGTELVGSSPGQCRLLDMEGLRSVRIHELRNLRCLRLRRGSFDLLPEGIENLRYLCILEVRECSALTSLPESLGALTGLTSLDLRNCGALRSLPESVGRLTGLRSLNLTMCIALRSLPESVGALAGLMQQFRPLRTLTLSSLFNMPPYIDLSRLPNWVGKMTGLTSLDLKDSKALRSLPESVGTLTGLTSLDRRRCLALASLPESVGALTRLANLGLSGCSALNSLPKTVSALNGLKILSLIECEALEILPASVGALTGLKRLCLTGCRALASLPGSIGSLTQLTSLDLKG
jgi:Leucine-rich repeat (LRR) protein